MTIVYSRANILRFQTDAKAAGYDLGTSGPNKDGVDGLWGQKSETAWLGYMSTKIYDGATFPYDDYKTVPVVLNAEITDEYIPTLNKVAANEPKGLRLLAICMTDIEGFYAARPATQTTKARPASTSYKTKNPGNVGNTDTGAHKTFATLEAGILAQLSYLKEVAAGKRAAYPLGKDKLMPPYYSKEIERNRKTYGIPAQLPGYHFVYTGQLNQFTKIYSTGARVLNSYVNQVISYFAQHGITLTPESTLAEIVG